MIAAHDASRRRFLRIAVSTGGALVVGFAAGEADAQDMKLPLDLIGDELMPLGAFVMVERDNRVVIGSRACEVGQGAKTRGPMLVAEELDVDWSSVKLAHGPASAAYYNGAMGEGMMPSADYAMPDWQRRVGGAMGEVGKLLGLQITGGSTSIRDGFDKMRLAGASAREALKLVAAQRLGVAVDRLRTEGGAVIAPDGSSLPYADLAEAAARIEPPQVEPRPASSWRLLGTELPRPDMLAKVTGTQAYGIDTRLPGMKFASVRMNPRLGGTPICGVSPFLRG